METLIASKAVDISVALEVMDWVVVTMIGNGREAYRIGTEQQYQLIYTEDFMPSHDLRHAWQVVEALQSRGFEVELRGGKKVRGDRGGYSVVFWDGLRKYSGWGVTPQLAICAAALNLVREISTK